MGLKFETSEQTCEHVRGMTDRVLLAFSTGKDSIASWLQLRRYWTEPGQIVPVFQYVTPGRDGLGTLRYINYALDYYENFFQTRIWRVPTPAFWRKLYNAVFMPPERLAARDRLIREGKLREWDYDDIRNEIRRATGWSNAWEAVGIRMNDSMTRRRVVQAQGSVHTTSLKFYPVWDWNMDKLMDEIGRAGVKLPPDYRWFRCSYESNMFHSPTFMRENPGDLQTELHWFPLADMNAFRHECNTMLHARQAVNART